MINLTTNLVDNGTEHEETLKIQCSGSGSGEAGLGVKSQGTQDLSRGPILRYPGRYPGTSGSIF